VNFQPTIANVTTAISQVLVQYIPVFLGFGVNVFRAFAVIALCFEGYRWMFGHPDGYSVARTLFTIALVYTGVHFYVVPIFGLAVSHIVPDTAQFFLAKLDVTAVDNANAHMTELWNRLDTPSLTALFENLLFWAGTILIIGAKMLSIAIISYGLVASAICTLTGPLFIPFAMFEQTRWLFQGWLKSSITYALIPVFALIWIIVFEKTLFVFVSGLPPTIPTSQYLTYFSGVAAVLGTMCFGLLAIPSFTSGLLSGHAHNASPLSMIPGVGR
jgi:type IV secretory pathway VirB6-like protein